ncbi:intron-binding protein aquarius [Eremomyces bilateralis CBS 781.70]|uniref:Pre-mRNA-splicing factor n=1 Tax=Eremomyces bilateralis CBS 781.70 TaxID=1392243 RepID=A0A6G1G475_9PEZI|nr:intron-binding protein aquarius [Eremomyces bilateralis CBS 781.70]KAF1812741.1 intron-binding protein aquarius [Eremomyces bilateralis CBS 781.70]
MESSSSSRPSNGNSVPFRHSPTARTPVADLQGDTANEYAELAKKHWLKSSKAVKVRPNVVKEEIWDPLEKNNFPYGELLALENLQVVESYLWPGFTENSSNFHVLLLALFVNVKIRENLPAWDLFSERPAEFSAFFRRVLSLTIDESLSISLRTNLVCFVIGAFGSLDKGLVRKECAPLVSIGVWHNLHSSSTRERILEDNSIFKKAWRAANKRFDAADEPTKVKLNFDRAWLATLLSEFLNQLYSSEALPSTAVVIYCERVLELLVDLQSQVPTRRYVNALVRDLNLLPAIRLSPILNDEDQSLLRDMCSLLQHYTSFPVNDQTGRPYSQQEYHELHCKQLARLQRVALKTLDSKLKLLSLSNYGSLEQRDELTAHVKDLDLEELKQLCAELGFRIEYHSSSNVVQDREFYLEVLLSAFERQPTFQDTARKLQVVPTERSLYEPAISRSESYDGSRPLALPKLNLQYLTVGDFLWRSFVLYRSESFFAIRNDVELVIKKMQPRRDGLNTVRFDGSSKMALPISKPAITDVAPAKVGEVLPSQVRAEIILDVARLPYPVRRDWESLKPDDVVFLAAINPATKELMTDGNDFAKPNDKIGLAHLRSAQIIQVQDENGKPLREQQQNQTNGEGRRRKQLRLIVNLDPAAYHDDTDPSKKSRVEVYENINLIIRRRARENNFKSILDSIRKLTLSDIPAPSWLQEVFLGYGDPSSASYKKLPNRLQSIDFRDTFLDWPHLVECLQGRSIEPSDDAQSSFAPPYVLGFSESAKDEPPRTSKKRRRGQDDEPQPVVESVKVSTYKPTNMGPYPSDAPKLNTVRFTPTQVEAIISGTQPGLTVIVGPPGTGKTDVATQIINNIYHNFPQQRTLLIAHSNQALNQLFQKIVALDIDERHLLRLGHGEEELETESSYSKHGRVDSFLEIGQKYLGEVTRLAANFEAPGAHGSSCETADYFNSVYVKPAWTKYWDQAQDASTTVEEVIETFPLHNYFSNAPQPVFPATASKDEVLEIAEGCYRHVSKIFSELEDIRPFEILRSPRDKANYLLIKEARIIAMTSTHAAMRRQEIANLGFHYDNVVMEEAAQITEIENFIPLALQKPDKGDLPLQRIVLCGDHFQNSPIIQNMAFRQYAKLEQSMFLRLVRLGVPTIMLDQQGRARPSIAELYKWRYPKLGNLPNVETGAEFLTANAGFRYDYQFIDVPDYKGKGEHEPSPHFMQNLGEAEYAVALFMYMRLLGYPASKISILTTYAGQRALIRDVLQHRCAKNRLFGMPRIVVTVDKYQGEQNDYIILSLVRSRRIGYLRDIRRLTVALSRARLGLYILGRREVFESCYELQEAFGQLFSRDTKLSLVPNEFFPTPRLLDAQKVESVAMEGVEHLGQYVYEMTQAKVEALKAEGGKMPALEAPVEDVDMDDEVDRGYEVEAGVEVDEDED